MRFVENQCMSDPLLDTPAEHVLVQTVEHKVGERPLQVFVLCRVDTDNGREFLLPQAALRLGLGVEETVVIKLIQAREQGTQSSVRLGLIVENLQETPESRFRSNSVRAPTCLLETLLN